MSPELGSDWQKFRMERPQKQDFDCESSHSCYELAELLDKSFAGENAARIASDPALGNAYFKFLDRIYFSENTYYLTLALEKPLKHSDETVRSYGIDAFYHVMETMGFGRDEATNLVDAWVLGMESRPRAWAEMIAEGLDRHMIPIIELERYKRGAFHTLFRDFGIANAERYYGRVLKYQYEFRDNKDLPYVQQIMAAYDYNESVLGQSALANFSSEVVGYNYESKKVRAAVRAIEVKDHDDLINKKQKLLKKYGQGKVSAYLLFGHSDGVTISLGGSWHNDEYLTMEDIINLDVFGKRSGEHMKHPTIILNSCSTGQKLAKGISEYFQARVYAPLVPANIEYIFVNKISGRVESVNYSDSSIIFDQGKIVKVVEPEY